MTIIGEGPERKKYVSETVRKMREDRLPENSKKYAALPENIRGALAKVAGVQNKPLADLSPQDRRKLRNAARSLQEQIGKAFILLVATCTESE